MRSKSDPKEVCSTIDFAVPEAENFRGCIERSAMSLQLVATTADIKKFDCLIVTKKDI